MNKKTLESIGAVLAGFIVVVILSVATDAVLQGAGVIPPATLPQDYNSGHLVLALIYRTMYTVAGGFVTAKLAPANPWKLIYALGILGTIGGIMGIIAGWNLSEHWYPIALAVLAFPSIWAGGWLAIKKRNK